MPRAWNELRSMSAEAFSISAGAGAELQEASSTVVATRAKAA
jgi:hypothetical protein